MPEDIENSGEAAKPPERATATEAKSELPSVDSPPLSPAGEVAPIATPAVEPIIASEPDEKIAATPAPWRLRLKARHKRQAALAASVALAAGIGAIVGALAMSGMRAPAPDPSGLQQRRAMQQSIDKLNHEIAALKANIEAGNKSARSQIAKISERLTRAPAPVPAPDITGSIPLPHAPVPTPVPRPDMRTTVVHDWSIYDVRDGYVAVRGHGDIYQVVLGAPLPGLGPVQQIKRQDGRWVVVTPKGLIVSLRDRRYFEPN
jgi:hypothetical protein